MHSHPCASVIGIVLLIAARFVVAEDGGNKVPAWVHGEKQTLVLKKQDLPAYLSIQRTATIIRPRPLTKMDELEKLNPGLATTMPALKTLIASAGVSSKFKLLYDNKLKTAASEDFQDIDDYFDCATVLNVTAPKSGRHAVLIQANMDTDTDGTDPVRLSRLKDYDDARVSDSFQPVLAYAWDKAGSDDATNPFLGYFDDTLKRLRTLREQVDGFAKQDVSSMWTTMRGSVDQQIKIIERRARSNNEDLRLRRSLIASLDPFIVIPMNWVDKKKHEFQMKTGDLAAVIHGGKVLPCLIGDTGPNDIVGEASQFLGRALNPEASGVMSAVRTAGVTYLVFPGTRKGMGPVHLADLHDRVQHAIDELGGLGEGVKLHAW